MHFTEQVVVYLWIHKKSIISNNGLDLKVEWECAEPHSSVGSVADLRTGGRWFDPRQGRGLMTVIATGFIPLSPLSVVSTTVESESSQWLGKNIVRSTG